MNVRFYLPRDLKPYVSRIENLSLLLTRFVPFFQEKETYKPKIRELVERFLGFKGLKVRVFDKSYSRFFGNLKDLWTEINAVTFTMKTKSRLVVGLGDESVYETSIRLHRNYGVPYIPGSALKGVAKHYVIYLLADNNYDSLRSKFDEEDFFKIAGRVQKLLEESDESKIDDEIRSLKLKIKDESISFEELRTIFGTQKREGDIIFFDAFPTPDQLKHKPILELDIMNPHYQSYYTASERELREKLEKAPGDWHQPNPIFFLTVPAGIEFKFALASRVDGKSELKKAVKLLKKALEEFGVGAKTSLGYGRFEQSTRWRD